MVTSIVADEGGHYCNYGLMALHNPMIVYDARPKIVDAPLTLISLIGQ